MTYSKRRYRQHIKMMLLVFSLMLALLHGLDFSSLLLPELIDIGTEILSISFSEKIYSSLVAILGTIILLISFYALLKRAFKIIDGKSDSKVKKAIAQRIYTSLDGFFEKFTVIQVCCKAVRIIRKYISTSNFKFILDKQLKITSPLLTFRFSRILI
ncbi:MAG: hypothetical protein E7677_00960 [Ruminococcaceae bacterium]|nr:hypothetical protein [Oscillospiraceae bacterium]